MARENLLLRGKIWYVRARVGGRDVWRSTGQEDFKAARRARPKILANLGDASLRPPTLREWWETIKSSHLKKKAASTQKGQSIAVEHALPTLGDLPIDEIPRSRCVAYLNARGAQVKPYTLFVEQTVLQWVFEEAVKEGLLAINPWKGIKKPPKTIKTETLSMEDQITLWEWLLPEERDWVAFMLGTGLRIAELKGMIFDLDREEIHVVGKGKKKRAVPMLDEIPTIVRRNLGGFTSSPAHWRRVLDEACLTAEIPRITPHTLRHTFATRYLQAGGDIYILSKILGHHSVTITERVYAHLIAPDLKARSRGLKLGLLVVAKKVAGSENGNNGPETGGSFY